VVDTHGRFAWYELMTTDVAAARTFYGEVMGWEAWDTAMPGGAYTLFTAGRAAAGAALELPADARNMGARPSWIGYVAVDDVDAAAEAVERLGGVVHVPPTDVPGVSRFAVFADPQTARLALFKRLAGGRAQPAEPDAVGRVGWHELLAADWEQALAFYGALFGWLKADAGIAETGTYQVFSAAGEPIGGMLTKPATLPEPFWLYYFNVADIDAAAERVNAGGGRVLDEPAEVPGGSWIVRCTDLQGALFALEGPRRSNPMGYFERAAPAGGRRWSW
jgi:uncharacterized protein